MGFALLIVFLILSICVFMKCRSNILITLFLASQENRKLQEKVEAFQAENATLKATVIDLSRDKQQLGQQVSDLQRTVHTVNDLQMTVQRQRQMIKQLQPANLNRLKAKIADHLKRKDRANTLTNRGLRAE
jgi:predicted RNase H-like nuclease (RuvC/YqgF family)